MSLRINSNTDVLRGKNLLNKRIDSENESMKKLSSGSRINKAADDAASLSISEKMRSSIRSGEIANRNANDGISLLQTAEGGLSTISNLLIRLKELSVQSATETISNTERELADVEYQQLKREISRISQSIEFNGKKLLNGKGGKYEFQIGTKNKKSEDRLTYDSEKIDVSLKSLFNEEEDKNYAPSVLETKISRIDSDSSYTNESERNKKKNKTQMEFNKGRSDSFRATGGTNILSQQGARNSLGTIDRAIQKVSLGRAQVGSIQNRMVSVISNNQESNLNLSTANSKLRDTDFAKESANSMKKKLLTNSATQVMGQFTNRIGMAKKLINSM